MSEGLLSLNAQRPQRMPCMRSKFFSIDLNFRRQNIREYDDQSGTQAPLGMGLSPQGQCFSSMHITLERPLFFMLYVRVRHGVFVVVLTAKHGINLCSVPGSSFILSNISNLLLSTLSSCAVVQSLVHCQASGIRNQEHNVGLQGRCL